jgi:hypothetical protein
LSPGNSIKNSSLVDACKGNQKERCLEIKGPVSNAKLDEAEIYYLDKARSSNTSDWVVAKGYRYFGKFDYGYRHGGLTPEETIVPFLTCEILQNEVLPLKMIFIGLNALQIGYTEVMKFQIRNDNEFSIQLHKIAVNEDPNFKVEFQELIPSLSPKTLEGKIKFPKSTIIKEGKSNINITLTYSVLGETYNQELTLRIPIRSTGNESLDELIK